MNSEHCSAGRACFLVNLTRRVSNVKQCIAASGDTFAFCFSSSTLVTATTPRS